MPALLTERIGPTGAVVGVDQSPDMLAVARHRIGAHGWTNVTLIESAVEEVELPMKADAALFCATHDVLQSEEALNRCSVTWGRMRGRRRRRQMGTAVDGGNQNARPTFTPCSHTTPTSPNPRKTTPFY